MQSSPAMDAVSRALINCKSTVNYDKCVFMIPCSDCSPAVFFLGKDSSVYQIGKKFYVDKKFAQEKSIRIQISSADLKDLVTKLLALLGGADAPANPDDAKRKEIVDTLIKVISAIRG
jgi:hypothetical protein